MKKRQKASSIKTSIYLWISGVFLSFILTAIFLVISTTELRNMTEGVYTDASAIEISHRLEEDILGERREALLYRITADDTHRIKQYEELKQASGLINEINRYSSSPEEDKAIYDLKTKFKNYKDAAGSGTSSVEEIAGRTDILLKSVETYRRINDLQMKATLEDSERLNRLSDIWSISLAIAVALIIFTGAAGLLKRILKPTSAITEAAIKYGLGDFSDRVELDQNDELGLLCSTFNEMADNIGQLQRNRVELIASVAHDLKNPLALIGMISYRLKRKPMAPEEMGQGLDRIIQQVQKLENMILDFLDMTQIEAGILSLNISEIELSAFINEILKTQNEIISTHHIEFHPEEKFAVTGDKARLERVITNLISNSVKYSPENSKILISLQKENDIAVITVDDEGVGISQEDIPRLFIPFERLNKDVSAVKGTGIGLFSSKKIIDLHGGTISIESKLGKGTTVRITLPLKTV